MANNEIARAFLREARSDLNPARSLFGDPNHPIWIPSERLGQVDAQQALDEATEVFDGLSQYLDTQHGIRL